MIKILVPDHNPDIHIYLIYRKIEMCEYLRLMKFSENFVRNRDSKFFNAFFLCEILACHRLPRRITPINFEVPREL